MTNNKSKKATKVSANDGVAPAPQKTKATKNEREYPDFSMPLVTMTHHFQ